MSQYLKPLTDAFNLYPVGTRVIGRDGRGDIQVGYVSPVNFGVVTREGAENLGRAWITVSTDVPVDGVFNMHAKATHKLWADTLNLASDVTGRPAKSTVAHLLVEVTFAPDKVSRDDAMHHADKLIDGVLSTAKQVERFYIRPLGTTWAD